MAISLVMYLPDFSAGGAERVNVNLAPELTRRGFEVTFVVHKMQGGLVPIIPPKTRVVSLGAKRTLSALLPLVRFLRREKPDVLLANIGPINIIALWAKLLAGVKTQVVVTQHSSLSHESKTRNWQLKITPALYRLFLWQAAGVVAVSSGIGDELATMAHIPRERVKVIYNPVITADFNQRLDEVVDHPWLLDRVPFLLGVGRLVGDKDFETLLEAFRLLVNQRDLRLIILGEGPLQEKLAALANRLGIADRVSMPGFVLNPLPFMRKAAVFVLSSCVEAFGNVLVEALACGAPVVSTACCYGPPEILDNGRFGRLVPVGDSRAMAEAIAATLDTPLASDITTARGREFTVARAAALYGDLFLRLQLGDRNSGPRGWQRVILGCLNSP